MTEHHEEGWFTDPFARHEHRWMSDGKPTKLVRDKNVESYDEVPVGPFVQQPQVVEDPMDQSASDLRRADGAQAIASGTRSDGPMAVWDVIFADGAPLNVMYLDEKKSERRDRAK